MLAIPTVAAILCLFLEAKPARQVALAATLADLALGIALWANFDIGGAQWQFVERADLFGRFQRSEEHTSELQSLMRSSYAVFCLKKKKEDTTKTRVNIAKNDT